MGCRARYSAISSAAVRAGPSITVSMISCQTDRLHATTAGARTKSFCSPSSNAVNQALASESLSGRRGERAAIRRHRKRDHRNLMPLEHLRRLRLARRPDRDTRVLPAGGEAPSRRKIAALTAPSWKRSTCSATSFESDQRITEVSKLPETARAPSGEIASARTGPPWPAIAPAPEPAPAREPQPLQRRGHHRDCGENQASVGHMPSARIFSRTGPSRSASRKATTAERSRRLSTRRKS